MLYEHLSTHPQGALFPFRLLRYMVRIWEQCEKENPSAPQLPLILPLVLYHGERTWTCASDFLALVEAPDPGFHRFVPNFSFLLDDIRHTSDEALQERTMPPHAKTALWFLKTARLGQKLLEELGIWRHELLHLQETELGKEAFLTLFSYYAMIE